MSQQTVFAPTPSIRPAPAGRGSASAGSASGGPIGIGRIVLLAVLTLALTGGLLFLWWPAGVAVGLLAGTLATVATGMRMQRTADAEPHDGTLSFDEADDAADRTDVRSDLEVLKSTLGDEYSDFARAATLVVSTQYASAARLQRELHVPYARARRLLADLEGQHFVGPATGSSPRQVLLAKEHLPELERLFAEV